MEDDPIPIEFVTQSQSNKPNNQDIFKDNLWEKLEPMPEGEARVMTRQFLDIDGLEIEVCINKNGKYFVRHNVYWWITYGNKNPSPEAYNIVRSLQEAVDKLPTIRWSGYKFRLETIVFSEDDVEVDSILLPLSMFEDLMKDASKFSNFSGISNQIREEIKKVNINQSQTTMHL